MCTTCNGIPSKHTQLTCDQLPHARLYFPKSASTVLTGAGDTGRVCSRVSIDKGERESKKLKELNINRRHATRHVQFQPSAFHSRPSPAPRQSSRECIERAAHRASYYLISSRLASRYLADSLAVPVLCDVLCVCVCVAVAVDSVSMCSAPGSPQETRARDAIRDAVCCVVQVSHGAAGTR